MAKLKYVSFYWGMEQSYSRRTSSLPHRKESWAACPVLAYCKEQLLSKPQPHLAAVWSELAHSWVIAAPLGRVSELGSVFRGLKEEVLETF